METAKFENSSETFFGDFQTMKDIEQTKLFFYFNAMIKVKRKIVDNEVHIDDIINCLDTPFNIDIAAIRCSLKSWRGMKFSLLLFWLLLVTKLLMFVLLKMRLFKVLKLATALSPLHKGWSHMHTVARMMFTRWLEQSGFTAGALLQDRLVTKITKWNRIKIGLGIFENISIDDFGT